MTRAGRPPRQQPRSPKDDGFLGYVRERGPIWGAFLLVAVAATLIFIISPSPAVP